MKMLFASFDQGALDHFSKTLLATGIVCEIRMGRGPGAPGLTPFPELWIEHDKDFATALRLLAARWQTAHPVLV
jgi:hypothetical protein